MSVYADLHIHSTQSDGELSTNQIVDFIHRKKLNAFSVTDHDTISHIPIIQEYLLQQNYQNQFIPGVEVSCIHSDYNIHILLYGKNVNCHQLRELFSHMHTERCITFLKMGKKLESLGYKINYSDLVKKHSNPGRPHLAKELVENHLVNNFREAFDLLLGFGKPAYVQKNKPSAKEVLDIAENSGLISSLAHYGIYQDNVEINELGKLGLQAVEIYHPDHTNKIIKYLSEYAKLNSLIITGGSDFHSRKSKNHIGSYGVDKANYTQFMERVGC